MLTERQETILRVVVEEYEESGEPVGSRHLLAQAGLTCGPSTVRKELAMLEGLELLRQPHISAGRVPTERGYRYYVDGLGSRPIKKSQAKFDLTLSKHQLDHAMRETTEMLARVTDLLALVSAPPIEVESVLRVEVVCLPPTRVIVVVVTSAGGVTKRTFSFPQGVDTGLAEWATGYLNEVLAGIALGARMLRARLAVPELDPVERRFIEALAPAFLDLQTSTRETLYVGGASHLMGAGRFKGMPGLDRLMEALEERVQILSMMRSTLQEPDVRLRIGSENTAPELASAAVVTANYGVATRNLGTVSLIGPLRIDYGLAISSVRQAADGLSDFVSDMYE